MGQGLRLAPRRKPSAAAQEKGPTDWIQNAAAESPGEVGLHSAHSEEGGDVGDPWKDFPQTS